MSRHVLVREQVICQTTFFVESIDETTRLAYRDIDCAGCLRQALAASEQRTAVIRDLLATAEEALGAKVEEALGARVEEALNEAAEETPVVKSEGKP